MWRFLAQLLVKEFARGFVAMSAIGAGLLLLYAGIFGPAEGVDISFANRLTVVLWGSATIVAGWRA